MNLDKGDRKLLIGVGAIMVVLVVLLALSSGGEEESGVPTTYSAQSKGAKAAYLYLKEEGYNVQRWEDSPVELPLAAEDTVLVLASPGGRPRPEEKAALRSFLQHGGRILATGPAAGSFLPETNIVLEPVQAELWREYQPEVLSSITRAGTIRMSPLAHWGDAGSGQVVHYAQDGKGIVVSYKVGDGEVVWWGANTPLTNAGISQSGNLNLLLNSLGGSKETRILWDEFFHQDHLKAPSIMVLPTWAGLGQCGLFMLVLLLTFARRNAPIRPLNEPSRLSPLEFVQTLGKLYRRANATRTALEVPYFRFRSLLIKRLGLRKDVSSAEMLTAARKKLGYLDPGFEDTVKAILVGLQDSKLKEAQALPLVQKLNRHARNLKLISDGKD